MYYFLQYFKVLVLVIRPVGSYIYVSSHVAIRSTNTYIIKIHSDLCSCIFAEFSSKRIWYIEYSKLSLCYIPTSKPLYYFQQYFEKNIIFLLLLSLHKETLLLNGTVVKCYSMYIHVHSAPIIAIQYLQGSGSWSSS